MSRSAIALAATLGTLSFLAATASAGARAQTQHFEVVSPLGAEIVGPAAAWLEQTRQLYLSLGLTLRERAPVTAVLTPTIVELAPYESSRFGRTRGLSLATPDHNYIVVAWNAPGDPFVALAHEYAHLTDPNPENPVWFREGLADYLSLLRPDPSGAIRPVAPKGRLSMLRSGQWLPHEQLLAARRGSTQFAQPLYYSQAWLAVRWLAAQEPDVRRLDPAPLVSLSAEEAEARLRALLEELRGEPEEPAVPAFGHIAVSPADPSETAYRLADLDRFIRPQRAREELQRLSRLRPGWLAPTASLGALAMTEGRYDEAEELLARAVRDPAAAGATHHRYAQVLLRPVDHDPAVRAEMAAIHAELALEAYPDDPRFLLTRAQALMVARQWDAVAGALRPLLAKADWRERARREFTEMVRRRQQAMRSAPPPTLAAPRPAALDRSLRSTAPMQVPPPPVQVQPPAAMPWPPPGTTVTYGRIDRVDCSGPDKLIILRHPLFRIQFREPKGRPAKLFFPPDKSWKSIPCGARGWTINIAHKPSRAGGDVRGDAVAILF